MFEFLTVDLELKPGSEDWRILEKVFAARANVRSLKNQGKSAGNAANAQVNLPLEKKKSTTCITHEKSMIHNYSRACSDTLDDMSCRYP